MNMLEYQKKILQKVSFSKDLFVKELKKSFNWLSGNEINDFINWVRKTFSNKYPEEINNVTKQLT